MDRRLTEREITRRSLLRAVGGLGLTGLLGLVPGLPGPVSAQGNLANLGPEEPVDATMKRLFGGRPIKDGAASINLDLPLIAENGAVVPLTVDVTAPMTPQNYVKAIYIISDKNRRPLNAKFNLTPAMGQAFVGTNLRLGETTDVRAVIEMSDGTLLQAKREVKVTVGGCGG
ncbi:MAG TPA: thiosulfate oxidation carrier protein SoxY [Candidatus Methylomirabilis sp.]|nr:thiosulfate oxidation carrier protein SoxY [Candidatus Methylomirabilis sp.]